MHRSLSILILATFSLPCMFTSVLAAGIEYEGKTGKPGGGQRIVLISGDEEYRSEELVVQFGRILAEHHGYHCTVLFAINKESGEIDPATTDNIPGLEALEKADLAVVFLRWRNLPDEQMRSVDAYLMSGRPVIGLRTTTHAFKIPADRAFVRYSYDFDDKGGPWQQGFGRLVLGETWIEHHGKHGFQATRGTVVPEREDTPVVRGCGDMFGPTDVYRVRLPLPEGCVPLICGQVLEGMQPTDKPVEGGKNQPLMPIAWLKTYQLPGGTRGRAFTSTMGSAEDFSSEGYRRLLVNAVYELTGLQSRIPERTEVGIVGDYDPSPMGFAKHRKGLKPNDVK